MSKASLNQHGDPRAGQAPATADRGEQRPRGRGWALLATSLGFGVVQLDVSVVNVAIKPIGADLGGSVSGLQWVVNAYTVTFAALILSAGALGDRIGAKRVFLAGFVVFTSASAVCGLAPGLGVLWAVQGMGAAALVPCSLTLLNHAYHDSDARARAVGLWAAGASVALSAGPLIGGLLIAAAGWRAIFFINLPIGLLAIGLTIRYARETPRSRERGVDLPGQAAAIVALVALAAAMVAGGERGFADPFVLGGFGLAAAAGVGFVLIEHTRAQPMLPLSLFGSRTFSAATAIGLVINVAFYGLIFVFSLYFQTTLHYSALRTGLAFAPASVAVLAANLLASRITTAIGNRRAIAAAAALMAASLAGLLVIGASTGYPVIVAQLAALGFGLGLVVPAMTAALLGSVEASRSGIASGTLNTARQAGSVIGVALFGALAAASLVSGLRLGLVISIVLSLATVTLSLDIKEEPGRRPRREWQPRADRPPSADPRLHPGHPQRSPLPADPRGTRGAQAGRRADRPATSRRCAWPVRCFPAGPRRRSPLSATRSPGTRTWPALRAPRLHSQRRVLCCVQVAL